MLLTILINEEDYGCKYTFNDYGLSITVRHNEKLADLFNKKDLLNSLQLDLEFYKTNPEIVDKNDLEYKIEHIDEYKLDNFDKVILMFNDISVVNKFIKENLSDKLVEVEIDKNDYNKIENIRNENFGDNVLFKLEDNDHAINFNTLIKTFDKLNEFNLDDISNLSPLEQLMYIYDKERDRVYQDSDKAYESRDFSGVINGDKIVCHGFARLFDITIKKLGFNSQIELLLPRDKSKRRGHARNAVYVNDPKYDIDGILYFDLTFGCKQEENDNGFLDSYKFFGRNNKFFKKVDDKRYESSLTRCLDKFNTIEELDNAISNLKDYDEVKELGLAISTKMIIEMSGKDELPIFTLDLKEIKRQYEMMKQLLDEEISIDAFTRCLINVRKKENMDNPEKYIYTKDSIRNAVEGTFVSDELKAKRLLNAIFGEKDEELDAIPNEINNAVDKYFETEKVLKKAR